MQFGSLRFQRVWWLRTSEGFIQPLHRVCKDSGDSQVDRENLFANRVCPKLPNYRSHVNLRSNLNLMVNGPGRFKFKLKRVSAESTVSSLNCLVIIPKWDSDHDVTVYCRNWKNQELENVNILITCKDSEKANQLKSVDESDLYV